MSDEEIEKAKVWLEGQKLSKLKFNKKAYELNKKVKDREEEENRRFEEEEIKEERKNS